MDIDAILDDLYAWREAVNREIDEIRRANREPRLYGRLTDEDVARIRAAPPLGEPGGKTLAELAEEFDVTVSHISRVRSGSRSKADR